MLSDTILQVRAGERLYPDSNWEAGGVGLRYQGDGNLVLYVHGTAVWASGTTASAGWVEMQADGNLVAYDAAGSPYWASGTPGEPGSWLEIGGEALFRLVEPTTLWRPEIAAPPPAAPGPAPIPDRVVRPLVGLVRPLTTSFGDETGPRVVHGCSDFGGVIKFHEDRDRTLAELDVVARFHQYIRVAWRLNGWLWTASGLTIDPIRDGWYDEAMRGYLQACHDRGLRVDLSCMDMYNWTAQQAEASIARVAQIAASVSPTVVLIHEWNEIKGTGPGGEESVDQLRALTRIWQQHYPWSLRGLSDPGSQDKEGMRRLSQDPANVALIHNTRWTTDDAIRRAFNARYENYPGKPIMEVEPTGPNGSVAEGHFTRRVYQPTESADGLFAIYTMHILTGQASTYFNDPALVSREPLSSTWGFKELPRAWRAMEIPEGIGQGRLLAGHNAAAPLQVVGSNALRADSVIYNDYCLGVISGGRDWKVRAGIAGLASFWRGGVMIGEQRVFVGDVFKVDGPSPTVVRILL